MTDVRQLASQLHEIAWSAVRRPAADPWGSAAGTREERRTGSLELLAVCRQLQQVLRRRIDLTIEDARLTPVPTTARSQQHAAYPARQYGSAGYAGPQARDGTRYGCRTRDRGAGRRRPGGEPGPAVVVRLADGPHDGGRDFASPGEILMYEAEGPSPDPPGYVPLLAWYVPSQDDANVYVFAAPSVTSAGRLT